MRAKVKTEKDILDKATTLIVEKFGVDQRALKLSSKQKNGIFYTFEFLSTEKSHLAFEDISYCITINVAGKLFDLYRN